MLKEQQEFSIARLKSNVKILIGNYRLEQNIFGCTRRYSMFDILAAACAAGLGAFIMLVILSVTDHLK